MALAGSILEGQNKGERERGIKRASETHNFQQVDLNSSRASERGEQAVVVRVRPVVSSIRGREREGGREGRTDGRRMMEKKGCAAVMR